MAHENKDDNDNKPHLTKQRDASPFSVEGIRGGTLNSMAVKVIMIFLIVIFAVGFLFSSFMPSGNDDGSGARSIGGGPDPVAKVGDSAVKRAQYEQISARQEQMMAQYGMKVGPVEYFVSRQRTLQSLIENEALIQAARAAGITVSDDEIAAETKKQIDDALKSQEGSDAASFRRQVESRYGSMQKYREEMEEEAAGNRDGVERSLLLDKLQKKIKDENKVTEDDYKKSLTKLKLRQIIIRPKQAPAGDAKLTEKNKADAKTKADKLAAQLKANPTPQNFAAIAKKDSDDLATKSKGGDLGWKIPAEVPASTNVRDQLVKSSGKIIGPMTDDTTGDNYIFMVENRVLQLPKDYAKNKAKLFKDFETQKDNEAWSTYQAQVAKAAQSEIEDPALQAYKMQTEEIGSAPADQQKALRAEAIKKYEEGLTYADSLEAAAIRYQMAQLYMADKQMDKAVEVLKLASEKTINEPKVDIAYASALRESGKKEEAIKELQKISKEMDDAPPAAPSMFGGNPNDALRYQIAGEFDQLGKKDLADKERKKVAPQGGPGMMGGGGMPGGGSITIPPQ